MARTFDLTRRHCLAAMLCPLPVLGQDGGRTLRVGPGERWRSFGAALRSASSGDTIELPPGDYFGDVGVAEQRHLTIRGLGSGAVLHADGQIAEGKAILVTRGSVTVENIEFRGARAGGNGAGIRFESGQLALRRCRFFDNENGLLSAYGQDMTLDIEACEFGLAPRHEGLLHHLLYVGAVGRLSVSNSHFGGGWRGHLLKSRAMRSVIRGNFLVDGPKGEASYELEFPDGGDNLVTGNVIAQSALTQNPTLVSVGAEARPGAAARLVLARNTLVNHGGDNAQFLRIWAERLRADMPVEVSHNLVAGPGQWLLPPAWDAGGNQRMPLALLRDAARGDYRLLPGVATSVGALR